MSRRKAARYAIKPLTLEEWARLGDPRAIARLAAMGAEAADEAEAEELAARIEAGDIPLPR
jgi:hypothetical protein